MNVQSSPFNSEFWIPTILGSAFVAWFLFVPSLRNIHQHWSVSKWETTDGIVTTSKTTTYLAQERQQTKFLFQYQYTVNGVEHTNDRFSFRFASGDQRTGVKSFRQGAKVTVYYDPVFPQQSVIDADGTPLWNYFVLISCFSVAVALAIRVAQIDRWQRRRGDSRPGEQRDSSPLDNERASKGLSSSRD